MLNSGSRKVRVPCSATQENAMDIMNATLAIATVGLVCLFCRQVP
jgi:hypothetical protein